jgi:hypothetical protein
MDATDYQAIDRIIDHLKLTFVAAKPPLSQVFEQVSLTAAAPAAAREWPAGNVLAGQ